MSIWPWKSSKSTKDPDAIELAYLRMEAEENQRSAAAAALISAATRVGTSALLSEVRHRRRTCNSERVARAAKGELEELDALSLGGHRGGAGEVDENPPDLPLPGGNPAQLGIQPRSLSSHERRMADANTVARAKARYPGASAEGAVARAAGEDRARSGRLLEGNYAPHGSTAQWLYEGQYHRTLGQGNQGGAPAP